MSCPRITDPQTVDLVLYHAQCTDGFGAAFAAWHRLRSSAQYVAVNHGLPPPDCKGKRVAMVDFCYPLEIINQIAEQAAGLIILDHHKTAVESCSQLPWSQFDLSHSGAVVSWNFFNPGREVPQILLYIEDMDLWRWKLQESRNFAAFLKSIPFSFEVYESYLTDESSRIETGCAAGSLVRQYIESHARAAAAKSQLVSFVDANCAVCNNSNEVGDLADAIFKHYGDRIDICLIWYYDHSQEKILGSLRSRAPNKFDVADIAKFFGGGGHPAAAGFQVEGNDIQRVLDQADDHQLVSRHLELLKRK